MFNDPKYNCFTMNEMIKEIISTQKFKDKYPWRTEFKSSLKPMARDKLESGKVVSYQKVIRALIEAPTVDTRTGKVYNLSPVDQKMLACALANDLHTCTEDGPAISFCKQEFPSVYKGNLCALEIINTWLQSGMLQWDPTKQSLLQEWRVTNEPHQPLQAIARFRSLTNQPYF